MVKLDIESFRHITTDEFRVLVAVEMGMKNHELVPTPLIERIAGLRHGGVKKLLGNLLRLKLIHHDSKKYDGYHLIYPGYDFLAIKTFMKRNTLFAVGRQIGVGKESDIHIVINDKEEENVIKFHRLGRVSFRAIKQKRDYLKGRKTSNWLYMSRLSALKEYAFMKALYEEGFPVPTPIDCNRHCVLMSLVNGFPLYQVRELGNPAKVYKNCMDLIVRFAQYGLIHSDFNEFNLLLNEQEESIIVIDFPQMVSTSHKNADMYFERDVNCIITFFAKRFGYVSKYKPVLTDIIKEHSLDVKVEASGFSAELAKEFDDMQADDNGESDSDDNEEPAEETQESEQPKEPKAPKEVKEPAQQQPNTSSEPEAPVSATENTTQSTTEPATAEKETEEADETEEVATTASAVDSTMEGSSIDYEYIKRRVKQSFAKKKGQKDYRTAQRNSQKGKDKRNARNTVKTGGEF